MRALAELFFFFLVQNQKVEIRYFWFFGLKSSKNSHDRRKHNWCGLALQRRQAPLPITCKATYYLFTIIQASVPSFSPASIYFTSIFTIQLTSTSCHFINILLIQDTIFCITWGAPLLSRHKVASLLCQSTNVTNWQSISIFSVSSCSQCATFTLFLS